MFRRPYTFVLCVLIAQTVTAADPLTEDRLSDEHRALFEQAAVVLRDNCLKCHSGEHPKGQLNLASRAGLLEGGESGESAYDADEPFTSSLVLAVNYEGFEMPPTGQMSAKNIAVLTKWIEAGLPWPKDVEEIEFEAESGPPPVNKTTKQFWSFQPVKEPAIPPSDHGHNPIDAFVGHRLKEHGLSPSPPAAARTLVRRMFYNLIGLAPTPEEAARWSRELAKNDGAINRNALRALVDELLASPHYGEQWGRHWLDLVRYAETNSYERDGAKPYVWRYRDYVIRSFNEDKPYDQFVREQLAGDELPSPTAQSIIATGYFRLGRWDDEPVDQVQAFYDDLDDIVLTTSQTFLGLTVNCARCHDHKIDPIPQSDYYRLMGFFHNIRRFGSRSEDSVLASSVREVDLPELEHISVQQQKDYEKKLADTRHMMSKIEKTVEADFSPVEKDDFAYVENRLDLIRKREGALVTKQQVEKYERLTRQLKELNDNRPSGLAQALCVTEDIGSIQPVHILLRGNSQAKGDEVTPGFPTVLSPPDVTMPEITAGAISSGRRAVLADWIAGPDNPLTARVMVNRIWQYHFGRGIVRSSSDFGFQGTPPTHPELLDWLAAQFVKNDWSVKDMHRLIMTSATYQMASTNRPDAWDADPLNDLFWRFDMRRLTAEEIRDSILQATGQINTDEMFGPSVYTEIPDEVKAGQSRPGSGWGNSSPEEASRRSIYIHVKRSLKDPLLDSFDAADTDQTCPVRFSTTQPNQALGMLNGGFIGEQAAHFAELLKHQAPDSTVDRVRRALQRVTQRSPTNDDIDRGVRLIEDLVQQDRMTPDEALRYFCLVALNLNEFIYLD